MEKIPISAVWPLQEEELHIILETGTASVVKFQANFPTHRFDPAMEWRLRHVPQHDGPSYRSPRVTTPTAELVVHGYVLLVG